MVTGITGGDSKEINLKAAFPRAFELENQYGSLFKAKIKLKKQSKPSGPASNGTGKGRLRSFKRGMGQLVEHLHDRYSDTVILNQTVNRVSQYKEQYKINTNDKEYTADELYVCIPAYKAADLFNDLNEKIAKSLREIHYAPIAVIGLVYDREATTQLPRGFGYLIPSFEKGEVLGVLFDSNIFSHRCHDNEVLVRVMLGGVRNPDIIKKSNEELINLAKNEIKKVVQTTSDAKKKFIVSWPKAIPQYDQQYVQTIARLREHMASLKNVSFVANYLKGIALNDCIENAYYAAQNSKL